MEIVVLFKPTAPEQTAERFTRSDRLDAHLLTRAEKLQVIGANKASIEKDLRVIESIMRSTENPELRDRLLQQLKAIHDHLLLSSLELLNTQRSLQVPKL